MIRAGHDFYKLHNYFNGVEGKQKFKHPTGTLDYLYYNCEDTYTYVVLSLWELLILEKNS